MKSTCAFSLVIVLLCMCPCPTVVAQAAEPGRAAKRSGQTPVMGVAPQPAASLHPASQADGTVYFGGTVWDAAEGRWEAVPGGTWTFDSGVGSSFDHTLPGVNPYKDSARHALMEGWVGKDLTYKDPDQTSLFRRVGAADIPCAVIGGSYSLHAGTSAAEAESLCYANGGPGYGNSWDTTVEHVFYYTGNEFSSYESITLQFDYAHEIEPDFEYVRISVGFPNYAKESIIFFDGEFTGTGSGSKTLVIDPFFYGPSSVENYVNEPVVLSFRFTSDGSFSDQDGEYATTCGGFSVDNIQVSGGGIAHSTDFESDTGGWTLRTPAPGPGGDYSDIVALADIDTQGQACASLQDSVLVFVDDNGGHNGVQENIAISPWIDLAEADLVDFSSLWVEFDLGAVLPEQDYNYVTVRVQSLPGDGCGSSVPGEWVSTGFVYFYNDFTCDRFTFDLTNLIAPGAQQVRVGLGVLSYCNIFSNCSGQSNSTPWFDNVRVGATLPDPVISVIYDSLSLEANIGAYGSIQLGIENAAGSSKLFWEIVADPLGTGNCPWLTLDGATSGGVEGGDFDLVSILFDAFGMPPGLYSCDLEVTSNDPQTPTVPLTVTLEIIDELNDALPGRVYASEGYAGNGELLQIDILDGAASGLGATRVQGMPGLAINSLGEVYGVGGTNSSVQELFRIDAQTGGVIRIGNTGGSCVQAMAFETDEVLYCVTGCTDQYLGTVDLTTGAVSPLLEMPVRMGGMAFDPMTGELFTSGEGSDMIYNIVPDGAGGVMAIPVGSLNLGLPIGDICFDGDGSLYGVIGEDEGANSFVEIDKSTGAGTLVGPTTISGITGLAMLPDLVTSVPDTPIAASAFALHAATPNPFNPMTRIAFEMPSSGRVTIEVFDSAGRRVRTILDEFRSAGSHEMTFRAEGLATGVYFYEMRVGDFRQIRKMTLLK